MEKDDNAIYSKPSVPDLPIKYRSQKRTQEGDKTENSEAAKQRAPQRPDTQRRVLAPELCLYVFLNINSMLFHARHRNGLLNRQRNRRDSPPKAAEYQEQSWTGNTDEH